LGASRLAAFPAPGALRRNLVLDVGAAVGVGVTTALVVSLLPTVARRGGLDPVGLALLAAAPFVANLLALFSGRIGPRTPRQLAFTRAAGAMLLLLIVLLPVPLVLTAVSLGFWISISFATPLQQRMWGAMYPARERGRLIGMVQTGKAAAAGAAVLLGGIVADRIGGLAVVALAGLVGAICATAAGGFRAPLAADTPVFSARECWAAFSSRPALRRVGTAQAFFGGGLIAAAPLYALVQVDRLHLSLAAVGVIGIVASVATVVSCLAWGALADRRGGLSAIQLGSILGFVSLIVYAMAPSVGFVLVAAACVGLANASTDVGISSVLGEHTTLEDRAAAMAGFNALTGARGIVAPFLAAILVQTGAVNVTGALLLCALSTGVGMVLYFRLTPAGDTRPWSAVVQQNGVNSGLRRAWALVPSLSLRG